MLQKLYIDTIDRKIERERERERWIPKRERWVPKRGFGIKLWRVSVKFSGSSFIYPWDIGGACYAHVSSLSWLGRDSAKANKGLWFSLGMGVSRWVGHGVGQEMFPWDSDNWGDRRRMSRRCPGEGRMKNNKLRGGRRGDSITSERQAAGLRAEGRNSLG